MKMDQLSDLIYRVSAGELSYEDIDELDLTGEEREFVLSQLAELEEEDAEYDECEEEDEEDEEDDEEDEYEDIEDEEED